MNISILGCGWLGFPLAKQLLADGHKVKGSTTIRNKMNSLSTEGILPYYIKLYEDRVEGDLLSFISDANWVIIDIPPGLRANPDTNFVGTIERLKDYLEKSSVKNVIFISSTSVYKNLPGMPEYTESDNPNADNNSGSQLISVENMLKSASFEAVILRFGGLLGPERHPVNYLANRKNIKDPEAPVNLIQQQDCIKLIKAVIDSDLGSITINAVYPEHPLKEEYYKKIAETQKLVIPEFDYSIPSKGKIISSEVIGKDLEFEFVKDIWL